VTAGAWLTIVIVGAVAFLVGRTLGKRAEQNSRSAEEENAAVASTDTASSSARFQSLIDQLPIGVTLFSAGGEVIAKNASANAMSGVRHIDALVEDAVERLAASTPAGSTNDSQLAVAGPPARNYALMASRLASGEVVVFADDVTTRERLESMRRDFVANLSHELKTPLGGMAALSDSMIGETDHEVIARLAERVASEAQRMSAVIDDLLDLSRIESRADVRFEEVDVATIVNEAVSLQRLNAEAAGIHLEVETPRLDPIRVDRTQMLSAVSNLVENAIKYSERGDTVRIRLSNGNSVKIEVSDEGIGISQGDLERIFERFYRVDRARSRATGGTGLGLAIAKHAVENNGGSIVVRSAEGQGSTFTITLPRGGAR
jgi:two-component system sensor histidine kinase SenX3